MSTGLVVISILFLLLLVVVFTLIFPQLRQYQRSRDELALTVSLLTSTLESTADGLLVVDSAGKIRRANTRFAEMWKIPLSVLSSGEDDRAIEFVLNQLKDPGAFVKKIKDLYSHLDQESVDILEFKDGRIFERYSRPQLVRDKIVGRVWSFRDATERKKAEVALRQRSQELARSNQELKQFTAIVSHDLQEPLKTIEGLVDRVLEISADRLDERGREFLERARKNVDRTNRLVDDLLAYSRVSARAVTVEVVDLSDVLQNVLSDLEQRVTESGAKIEVGPLPKIEADRSQMGRLFQNLLCNALKFTDKSRTPFVSITARELDAGNVEISVRDNGIGFEQEEAQKIFEPFQRLHDRKTFPGSGLGLAVCRKIVERHGGRIDATGAPGQGATFTVTLPKGQSGVSPHLGESMVSGSSNFSI